MVAGAPLIEFTPTGCLALNVVGALFVAILIARLAGIYPPRQREAL